MVKISSSGLGMPGELEKQKKDDLVKKDDFGFHIWSFTISFAYFPSAAMNLTKFLCHGTLQ